MRKNIIISIVFLIIGVFYTPIIKAQDSYQVFKFHHEGYYLTYHETTNDILTLDEKYLSSNELSQFFIIKKEGEGYVLIASAKDPDRFLKRGNGDSLEMTEYNDSDRTDFLWKLDYAGFPWCVLTNPEEVMKGLVVKQNQIKYGDLERLEDNNATDNFRFKLAISETPSF